MADVAEILASAARLEQMAAAERARVLVDRTIALLFYESSTRTRTSFELAAKSLGVTTTLVSDKSSSIEKGESLKDTGLTLRALGAEAIVLRHPASGAPFLLARVTGLPVLNAGDGMHQHPSQALLDLRTILLRLGLGADATIHAKTLDGVTVVIAGDIRHSRVARSNAMLLPRLGARVVLCGPPELLPEEALGLNAYLEANASGSPAIEIERDFDRALRSATVVMMLRIQKERLEGTALNLAEYVERYQLHGARLAALAPHALVMHPGPIIRGLEITGEVADGPQSAIEEQVAQGLAVRRAVLVRALGAGMSTSCCFGLRVVLPMVGTEFIWRLRGCGHDERGRVVDPEQGVDAPRDVLLRDGRVAAVEPPGALAGLADSLPKELQIDAAGCVVAPGLIDIHVHLREPGQTHKETIATRHGSSGRGRIHHRRRHAQHHAGERFGGEPALDARGGARSADPSAGHAGGDLRQQWLRDYRLRTRWCARVRSASRTMANRCWKTM